MDDLKIWNTPLTDAEIQNLYNDEVVPPPSPSLKPILGCVSSTTISITITENEDADFTYPEIFYCQATIGTVTPTITGILSGTFTSSPTGLVIDPSTGIITPELSSVATYTIEYTTPGGCEGTSSFTLSITDEKEDASFNYPDLSYCKSTIGTVTPTITGVSSADISDAPLSGTLVVGSDMSRTYTITADGLLEGSETLTFEAAGETLGVQINDTSNAPITYSLVATANTVNEGESFSVDLVVQNGIPGITLPYTVTGISQTDLSAGSVSGNYVTGTQTSQSFTIAEDFTTEGTETFVISLTTISGITTYSGRHFFVPPQGDTASRPSDCKPGSFRFNTDTKHLEYFRGNTIGWVEIEASSPEMGGGTSSSNKNSLGARALMGGGHVYIRTIEFFTVSNFGDTQDFGDLTEAAGYSGGKGASTATRGLFAGGYYKNAIEFVTIASTGNSTDFGDLTHPRLACSANNDTVRAVFSGGQGPGHAATNIMDYVSISSTGNALDFGDMGLAKTVRGSCSSSTRGIIQRANNPATPTGVYESFTIRTLGNATEFGDTIGLIPLFALSEVGYKRIIELSSLSYLGNDGTTETQTSTIAQASHDSIWRRCDLVSVADRCQWRQSISNITEGAC